MRKMTSKYSVLWNNFGTRTSNDMAVKTISDRPESSGYGWLDTVMPHIIAKAVENNVETSEYPAIFVSIPEAVADAGEDSVEAPELAAEVIETYDSGDGQSFVP